MKKLLVAAAAVAVMSISTQAVADQFAWTYTDIATSGATESGSGTFTTSSASSPFDITGFTGTADGYTITGISTYAGATNLLYVPATASPGHVDFGGISFLTNGVGGTLSFNIGGSFVNGQYVLNRSDVNPTGFPGVDGSTPINFSVVEVPEPGVLALLGVGILGAALRRRRG